MMRFLRVVLALVFGFAVAGPEAHACPVHSATHAPAHHQDAGSHQETAPVHCTCPQPCCPTALGASLPASAAWVVSPGAVLVVEYAAAPAALFPSRAHVLPFAIGPPVSLL
jgi:hypothetical protein